MPLLGFLNELSTPAEGSSREVIIGLLSELARSVQAVRRWCMDFALHTEQPIPSWRFGLIYGFGEFLRDTRTRDEARLLLAAANRTPMRFGLAAGRDVDGDLEYRCHDQVAEAAGLAHLFDGFVLSFSDRAWRKQFLSVERTGIVESANGQAELVTNFVDVRNVCTAIDVEAHRPWLETAGKVPFESFEEFEATRRDRLSNIEFLGRALSQLKEIKPTHPWWNAVGRRLDELQEAIVAWNPAETVEPLWRSHITGEHQQRKSLCEFVDLDGVTRCFDQHARFTPNAGRLHFRLDPSSRRLIIAHIGLKLW